MRCPTKTLRIAEHIGSTAIVVMSPFSPQAVSGMTLYIHTGAKVGNAYFIWQAIV